MIGKIEPHEQFTFLLTNYGGHLAVGNLSILQDFFNSPTVSNFLGSAVI
jgi:hypothetical protein